MNSKPSQVPRGLQRRLWSIAMKDPARNGQDRIIEQSWLAECTSSSTALKAAIKYAQSLGLRVIGAAKDNS